MNITNRLLTLEEWLSLVHYDNLDACMRKHLNDIGFTSNTLLRITKKVVGRIESLSEVAISYPSEVALPIIRRIYHQVSLAERRQLLVSNQRILKFLSSTNHHANCGANSVQALPTSLYHDLSEHCTVCSCLKKLFLELGKLEREVATLYFSGYSYDDIIRKLEVTESNRQAIEFVMIKAKDKLHYSIQNSRVTLCFI